MNEHSEFFGRHYSEEEKKNLGKALQKWSDEALKPIKGELEKTEEEVEMIEAINSIIQAELASLGIREYKPIPQEKIHILPGEIFKENFPDFEGRAFFLSTSDAVYVDRDKIDTKARAFSGLLHELIHRASTTKFYVKEDGGGVHDARVGYRIRSPWKESSRENRLQGFNELMTDYTVYKILFKNQQMLESTIGITKEEIQGAIYTYMNYEPILESIIKKISEDKAISSQEVFDDLERGQFESNILVLKDIEKSFGKGSLGILSLLETLKKREDNDKLEEMIKIFFAEQDETVRRQLQFQIKEFESTS